MAITLPKLYAQYIKEAYTNVLNPDSIPDFALRKLVKSFVPHYGSMADRLRINVRMMLKEVRAPLVSTTVISFNATMHYDDGSVTATYAYEYVKRAPGDNKIKKMYVTINPTYDSQDGEYRMGVSTARYEDEFWSPDRVTFLRRVEEVVVDLIESGKLELGINYYGESAVADAGSRLGVLRLCIAVTKWIFNSHMGATNNHVNVKDAIVLDAIALAVDPTPEDINLLIRETSIGLFPGALDQFSSVRIGDRVNHTTMIYGQKLFPLSPVEAVKIGDINFAVWREKYIATKCSNLVVNLISPCFAIIGRWIYIQNSDEHLYDNDATQRKHFYSSTAADIAQRLIEIDAQTYEDGEPISPKFAKLSRQIRRAAVYANAELSLTNLSLCVFSEYAGMTFRDAYDYATSDHAIAGQTRDAYNEIIYDTKVFDMYVFELIYSLFCCNMKLWVVHGDLHLNNITVFKHTENSVSPKIPANGRILYIIDDRGYSLPFCEYHAAIIDFSRAFIGDYKQLEHEFGAIYAEMYLVEQRQRVMQTLLYYLGDFVVANQSKLETLILNNFKLFFKIFTIVDTIAFASNMQVVYSTKPTGVTIAARLKQIVDFAESLVVELFERAFVEKLTAGDIEWPNKTILEHFFAYAVIDPAAPTGPIIDIYNSNAGIIYDIEDADNCGPLVGYEIERRLIPHGELAEHMGIESIPAEEASKLDDLLRTYELQIEDILDIRRELL